MSARIVVSELWAENLRGASAIGIGETAPRLSWIADGASDRWLVELRSTDGRVLSAPVSPVDTRLVEWPFAPLGSRDGGVVRVRADPEGEWSDPVAVEAGLLDRSDWVEPFVTPSPTAPTTDLRPGFLLRAGWRLSDLGVMRADIRHARVYSTAHGVYELEVNGRRIADDVLAPGWTSYRHRLRYQTADITDLLVDGPNAVGARVADGWYRGRIGFDGGLWNVYGDDVAVLVQLELTLIDGAVVRVPLGDSWRWAPSPVTQGALYEGERYDARLLPDGWSSPGFDASGWSPALTEPLGDHPAALVAPTGPPVRVIEALAPVGVTTLPSGRIRLDFGQNISGVLRIRPAAAAGHTIRLHHAEVLEDGRLGVRPLRAAISVDEYVCSGTEGEEWTPRTTIHGFRYAELENWPGALADGAVEALVVHTDMRRTGWFESSHAGLDQLHSNVVWSMRDNFVDLPTDCPQRDERLGWTGDIQVFAPTALLLHDVHGTLTGWLRDLAAEQEEKGHVPNFVPWIDCGFPDHATAAWGDAAVIVPWALYEHGGDLSILRDQFPSMRAWVDLVDRLSDGTGLWGRGFQLGDWLDPAAPPESPGDSHTDKYLVATAYHARTARLVADAARLLGEAEAEARYVRIAERAAAAFRSEYLSSSGRVVSDTPTSIALAVVFELFDSPERRARAGERLVELVAQNDFRISTGFIGTPIICDALAQVGAVDAAYHLLLQDELPSWLYQVGMGATTVWERWDSMLPDGSVNPGDMTSFNHYALGAVAGFLHRVVAGLDSVAPGGRRLRMAPRPGGGLTHASAVHDGPLGRSSSSWWRDGERLTLEIEVPVGATAIVELPDGTIEEDVPPGRHLFTGRARSAADDPPRPVRAWRAGPDDTSRPAADPDPGLVTEPVDHVA